MEFLFFFLVLVPIGGAIAHYINSRADQKTLPPGAPTQEDVEELRGQVGLLTEQLAQLTENQEFLTRLLESRPSGSGRPDTEESDR